MIFSRLPEEYHRNKALSEKSQREKCSHNSAFLKLAADPLFQVERDALKNVDSLPTKHGGLDCEREFPLSRRFDKIT
jgi:hypothetical protein